MAEQVAQEAQQTPEQQASMGMGENPPAPGQPATEPPPHADPKIASKRLLAIAVKPPDKPVMKRDHRDRQVPCYYLTYIPHGGTTNPQRQIPCTPEVWRKVQREHFPRKFRLKFTITTNSHGVAYRIEPNSDEEQSEMKSPVPDADNRNVLLRSYDGGEYHPERHPDWITQGQLDEVTDMVNQNPGYLQPGNMLLDKYAVDGVNHQRGYTDVVVRVT